LSGIRPFYRKAQPGRQAGPARNRRNEPVRGIPEHLTDCQEPCYDKALATVDHLWGAKPGTPNGDRLDVLLALIEHYEAKHHPIDPPDPIEAIKFRMEQMGLTRKDLEPMIGPRNRVAEVINRRRSLSLAMIRNLHTQLNIPLESLIRAAA
jgi:HTH-type transcriptional regulator/antitoxin HigA